jgi:hypothetical protein
MRQKLDKYWVGILLGLVLPAAVGWGYVERFNLWYTFEAFDWNLMRPILGRICQVGVFPNMALLFVFYTLEWWKLAKGVLLAAVPYLIASIFFMT